jgi:hypothetical protein
MLDEKARATVRAIANFLNGRLEESATIDWALHLNPNETVKRLALLELIDRADGRTFHEPWRTAWQLIQES